MRRSIKLLLGPALLAVVLTACNNEEKPVDVVDEETYDEAYYATHATVSSNDDGFSATDGGYTINFARGGGNVVVNVECGVEWTAVKDLPSTISATADVTSGVLTVSADENLNSEDQSGTITLQTAESGIRFALITLTQPGKAYVELSSYELSFDGAEGTASVTVTSNYAWGTSYDTEDWYTIERDGDDISVTVTENYTGETREGEVTVIAGDGENTAEAILTFSQESYDLSLKLQYTITNNDQTVYVPLYGTVDCTVNWGDGSEIETVVGENPDPTEHTYASRGIYEVTVSGTVTALYGKSISTSATGALTAVLAWGNTGLTDLNYAFYKCTALSSIPETTGKSLENVTIFDYFFNGCSLLTSVPADLFGTSATSLTYAFDQTGLKEIPAGLFDNCSNVTTMKYIFGETPITKIPEGLFDNCSSLTTASYMFYKCTGITSVPDALFYKLAEVTTFEGLFMGCSGLVTVDEDLFRYNTKVTSFRRLFCNTSRVDYALNKIPAGLFKYNTEVTTFEDAFYSCTGLTEIPEDLFANNTKVTNMTDVFYECTGLTTIPEAIFAKNTEVTSFNWALGWCTGLSSIPAGIFDNNRKVTNFASCFNQTKNLTGESPYTVLSNGTKVHLYERANYPDEFTEPTSTSSCFGTCTKMTDYYSIPSAWGGGGD